MPFLDFLKRKKNIESRVDGGESKYTQPTPETMFALNTQATQWLNEGSFAEHGFESQLDLVAAFTIVETLGASDRISDKEIIELLVPQFDITPDRCAFLIRQARRSIMK
jgi:hypothetical protein